MSKQRDVFALFKIQVKFLDDYDGPFMGVVSLAESEHFDVTTHVNQSVGGVMMDEIPLVSAAANCGSHATFALGLQA